MPTYEYRCPSCAHEYEKREGFDAPAVQKCPSCGKRARRVLHAAPVVFKGSGFYVNDSRTSAPAEESPATPEPSKNGEGAKPEKDSPSKDTEAAATS